MARPITRRLSFARLATIAGVTTGVVALGISACAAANPAPSYAPSDPGVCNRGSAGSASIAFELADGSSLWQRIPNMGLAPELESVDKPITVVVFEGPHHSVPILGQLQAGDNETRAGVLEDVVCVVSPTGEEVYYTGVDMTGLDLTGLEFERYDP